MTLPLRRALALFFICLFVIVAPAALAYGRGYRFNLLTKHFELTGVILLHGKPKNAFLSINGQNARVSTLPKVFRSITPGTHTIAVSAAQYTTQKFSLHVQPGKTSYVTNIQLLQSNPFATIRTGLPRTAQLSPTGALIAWVEANRIVIASTDSRVESSVIPKLKNFQWSHQSLDVFDEKQLYLGQVNRTGLYLPSAKREVENNDKLNTLAQTAGIRYTHAQRVDALHGWFLTNAEGGWILQDDGLTEIVSRWSAVPLAANIIGNSVLAIVRQDTITLRNLVTNQVQNYPLAGIQAVAKEPNDGIVNLLVQDGDLLSWVRAAFF